MMTVGINRENIHGYSRFATPNFGSVSDYRFEYGSFSHYQVQTVAVFSGGVIFQVRDEGDGLKNLVLEWAGETLPLNEAAQDDGGDRFIWNQSWLGTNAPGLSASGYASTLPIAGMSVGVCLRTTDQECPSTEPESVDLPEVSVASGQSPMTEGTAAAFMLTRSGDTAEALTVTLNVSEDGAVLSGTPLTEAVFTAGESSVDLSIATEDDGLVETASVVTVALASGTGYTVDSSAGQASVTVEDNDTAPALTDSVVEGATLTLTFDKDLDEDSEPGTTAFSVSVADGEGGSARGVNAVTLDGRKATLTLASGVSSGDTVTVSYTAPTGPDASPIQDEAGNPAASFAGRAVRNTTPVPNALPVGLPEITGATRVGQTLTASASGITDSDGLSGASFAWQWIANDGNADTEITGATSATYALTSAEVGKRIKVQVTFTDDRGEEEILVSDLTAAVVAANVLPTGLPEITGTTRAGEILTASVSEIADDDGLTGVSFAWQWITNDGNADTEITGATSATYRLTSAEVGKRIKVQVTFTDDRGEEEILVSDLTAAVVAANVLPTGLPEITGAARAGETLTASASRIRDSNGLTGASFAWQWIANDGNADTTITGATSATYALTSAEVGKRIKVRVTFTDDDGTEETMVSGLTAAVVAANVPTWSTMMTVGIGKVGNSNIHGFTTFADPSYGSVSDQWFEYGSSNSYKAQTLAVFSDGVVFQVRTGGNNLTSLVLEWAGETLPLNEAAQDDGGDRFIWNQSWLGTNAPGLSASGYASTLPIAGMSVGVCLRTTDQECPSTEPESVDLPEVSVASGQSPVTEGTAAAFMLTRSGDTAEALTVTLNVSEDGAVLSGTPLTEAVFTAGESSVDLSIATEDDGLVETASVVTVALASGTGYTVDSSAGQASVTVEDNDTAPALTDSVVEGATLTLTFDKDLDEDSEPGTTAFSVSVADGEGGSARGVNAVTLDGRKATLTLASGVSSGDTVTVSYTAPTGPDASPIQDEAGNPAASFAGRAVRNTTPVPNALPVGLPEITGATRVGQTLTASASGITDSDGLSGASFAWQWIANDGNADTEITGATSATYALTPAEVGKRIKVQVTFTDDRGEEEILVSDLTAAVEVAGMLVLNVSSIATDDVVNIAEKASGFEIAGDTGTEPGVSVTARVGTEELTAESSDDGAGTARWTVSVPADASYLSGTGVEVRVSASKAGFTAPAEVVRTLSLSLVGPVAPTYTEPSSLRVGEAITAMSPGGGAGIAAYGATGLPSGLVIDGASGVISGTPDRVDASPADTTVTVTDAAGNPATVSLTFPAVSRGAQVLAGFGYSSAAVTYGGGVPTVTAPTGALSGLVYTAEPATVCTVDQSTGALEILGIGDCVVTVASAGTADYEAGSSTFTVKVESAGTLVLNLSSIATDDVVNIAEKASGFGIAGDTGTEPGVSVTVRVGTEELTAESSDDGSGTARWTVSVPQNASYLSGTDVEVRVSASKAGFTAPAEVVRTLSLSLVGPVAPTYTEPSSLRVGEAITAMSPGGGAGIAAYVATGLPSGLVIDGASGVISGTPDRADADPADATVTVTDAAGNPATVSLTFPAVSRGAQVLAGFGYSSAAVTYGGGVPTVTAPTGALSGLVYTAEPATVCTVDQSTGALEILGIGDCVVTVASAGTADYEAGSSTFTVKVESAGTLVLNVSSIATDDVVNIAEKASGFEIAGDTGTEPACL